MHRLLQRCITITIRVDQCELHVIFAVGPMWELSNINRLIDPTRLISTQWLPTVMGVARSVPPVSYIGPVVNML